MICTDPRENWVIELTKAVDKKKDGKKIVRKHFGKVGEY